MTVLYNCRHDGDQYRITKFNDGEVESSYLTTHENCDCPAGHRSTCRHRQMLPSMLLHGIVDTHWFLDWDGAGYPVDLMGTPKSTIDALIAPLEQTIEVRSPSDVYTEKDFMVDMFAKNITPACVPVEQETSSLCEDEGCPQHGTEHVCIEQTVRTEPPHKALVRTSLPPASWRRL
jgi:hypothetical protein